MYREPRYDKHPKMICKKETAVKERAREGKSRNEHNAGE
jgi:hypothetical protein